MSDDGAGLLDRIDEELRNALLSHDDDALAKAGTSRAAVEAWSGVAREEALDWLAAIDRPRAVKLAFLLTGTREVRAAEEGEMRVRRGRAWQLLCDGIHLLSAEEAIGCIADGRYPVRLSTGMETENPPTLRSHPGLATGPQLLAAAQRLVAFRGAGGPNDTLLPWLLMRLAEVGHPPAVPFLLELRAALKDGLPRRLVDEALCATRERGVLELLCEGLGDNRLGFVAGHAVFYLDPAAAYDRLAPVLSADPQSAAGYATLRALAEDGLSPGQARGTLSSTPQGWMKGDPRWAELLLTLKKHPYVGDLVRRAFSHSPPPSSARSGVGGKRKGKKGEAAAPRLLQQVAVHAIQPCELTGSPVFVASGERFFALPADASTLQLFGTENPSVALATIPLPDGLRLPASKRDPYEGGWDRSGVHGVAVDPSGARIALVACHKVPDTAHPVVVLDRHGAIVASPKGSKESDLGGDFFAHSIAFDCKGELLFVGREGEAGHEVVVARADDLEPIGTAALGASFPDPPFFRLRAHPREQVCLVEVLGGQDGSWLKCISARGERIAQPLDKGFDGFVVGLDGDGATLVLGGQSKLKLRSWPKLAAAGSKNLPGQLHGGAASGQLLVAAVADLASEPDTAVLVRLPAGDVMGTAPWPKEETLAAVLAGELLVTVDRKQTRATVWRVPSS